MSRLEEFERQAMAHMDAAHNLAYWLLRSRADADDVVQDAYLRAWRAFDSFAGGNIKPWLLTIVRNVAYRHIENRKRSANVVSLEGALQARGDDAARALAAAATEPDAEALLIGAAERRLVIAALGDLPPQFREVLVLREIEGQSYAEIAAIVGVPAGTVMSRLSRGRAQLKARLEALIAEEDKDAV
jgi:RNA polymerase sigma-70 factor (ECF subfamily)